MTEWHYIELTVAAFVFAPELRRLIDWRGHFDPLNIVAVLPTAMLLPILLFIVKRRAALRISSFAHPLTVWIATFAYALVVGAAQHNILPGLYAFGLFVFPALIGAWLVTRDEPMNVAYNRISNTLLTLGGVAGAYGIVQYVLAPPWDTDWMRNITALSFGEPEPFGIRVFSVLNGPGVFANFMAGVLLISLPAIRPSRPLSLLAALLIVASLALSLVRSAWLAVAVGVIVALVLSPERRRIAAALSAVTLLSAVGATALFTLFASDNVKNTVVDRITTLSDVEDDHSVKDREEQARVAIQAAMLTPQGHGLGVSGPSGTLVLPDLAAQEGLPEEPIDNGFIARFVEMGFVGLFGFCAFLALSLLSCYRRYASLRSSGNREAASILASLFATQVALVFIAFAGDLYQGIGGIVLFSTIGMVHMPSAAERTRLERTGPRFLKPLGAGVL